MNQVNAIVNPLVIERLKKELAIKVRFTVSGKSDCMKLSELISESGAGYLSVTTIYRIYFQPDKHNPYKSTLNILCRFLGYADISDFLNRLNLEQFYVPSDTSNSGYLMDKHLIFHCLWNNSFKPLNDFFDALSSESHDYKTSVTLALFDNLQMIPNPNTFINYFANQKFVREYLMEQGYDPKFRIKYFDLNYSSYLKGVNKYQSISSFQDYIFGNCVIFRYYLVTKNYKKAQTIGKSLYAEFELIESQINEIYIFPFIRFMAYKLWYLKLMNTSQKSQEDYAYYLLQLCQKLKPKVSLYEQNILFHTIAETFIYSSISEVFHSKLKIIFEKQFAQIPAHIFHKKLECSLNYFEPNGIIYHRP